MPYISTHLIIMNGGVKMFKTKKAQSGGLITGLVFGIASLVIGVIVAFVIVSTMTGAGLLGDDDTDTETVTKETNAWINATPYQLGLTSNASRSNYAITHAWNSTSNTIIESANWTLSSVTGILTNATTVANDYKNVSFNYTFTHSFDNSDQRSVNALSANFTAGVDNVSEKIPTILLIAAIVLILGVLVLLVGAWQRMRMGGGGI